MSPPSAAATAAHLSGAAGMATVGGLFRARAVIDPTATAVIEGERRISYAELAVRTDRLAHVLAGEGRGRGERVAMLARNRTEWLEVELACAHLGAITAAQNWRLGRPELAHCLDLAAPRILIASEEEASAVAANADGRTVVITLGPDYERRLAQAPAGVPPDAAAPEDGLVILYTSGTTGLPKGAVISHRAMIARAAAYLLDLGLSGRETFIAWAPFFHMLSTDHALSTLLRGGTVAIVDGYQPERLIRLIETETIGWLPVIPGMIEPFLGELRASPVRPQGIGVIGAMADLCAPHQIAEATARLEAPFINTFGATETGLPPATADIIAVGVVPTDLAKRQSSFCEVGLVDEVGREVAMGEPGECAIRGPTVFSGYFRNPEATARDFRGGRFHMGDIFIRREDGRLAFVDRAKYLIKTGGENVYPAEIERVLLADPRVDDAVVVRRPDPHWGEVPVAVVAANDPGLTAHDLEDRCRAALAGYKRPKAFHFVAFADLPRSTTGKVQRHEVEAWLQRTCAGGEGA